jgi:hypothetical protein
MEEKLSSNKLKEFLVSMMKLKCVDPLLGDPLVAPCGKDKKLPEVRSCFF